MDISKEKCPQCFRPPSSWLERPAHGSRELYWIGCRKDGHLVGGNSEAAATQVWDRLVHRWKFDHCHLIKGADKVNSPG